ncbi:MAG TPA: toll/interleukin-1 receptor domain-containing protein [Solirubrobacterales bacterium]|nr:toll/interleukin-1 receptor domain-containing protein [Solirubrobacterales bacterium]
MLPEVSAPDYLPEQAVAWARVNQDLLERLVDELLATGSWPALKAMTRKLAREGKPIALERVLNDMPRPLGFLDTGPDSRIVLLLHGLRMTHTGRKLLAGFTSALLVAKERYAAESDDDPFIGRVDISQAKEKDDPYVNALGEILLREAPFLGGGSGLAHEEWTREVTANIVPYWDAADADAYLRIRAAELSPHPQFGWGLPGLDTHPGAGGIIFGRSVAHSEIELVPAAGSPAEDYSHDVFISHASEDKDAVARPLVDALGDRGWSAWLDELEITVGDSLTRRIDQALVSSRFGVVILSPSFFAKEWPQRELAGLAAREIAMGSKVILPVWHEVNHEYIAQHSPLLADRFGALTSTGIDSVVEEIASALEASGMHPGQRPAMNPVVRAVDSDEDPAEPSLFRIPMTAVEQAQLLADQPEWWEFRLYAGVLMEGRIDLEDKWRDHELRLPNGSRREPDPTSLMEFLSSEIGWLTRQVEALDRLFAPSVMDEAFGKPGEPGNKERIIHTAQRVIQTYEAMMDWAAGLRNTLVPSECVNLLELNARMAEGPIRQIRDFVQTVSDQIARIPALIKLAAEQGASKQDPMIVELTLNLSLDKANQEELFAEIARLR